MDSKIAFLNLATDYYRSDESKIFLNCDDPTMCKSCSKFFYFIDKNFNFCNTCFLNNCCAVDFNDDKIIIKIINTDKIIFQEDISILSDSKEKTNERSTHYSMNSINIVKSTIV